MTALDWFNAARAYKREVSGKPDIGLTEADVEALHTLEAEWKALKASPDAATAPKPPFSLKDPQAFFKSLRAALGRFTEPQVEGFNALLEAMGKARWPRSWAAYGLATAWWETAKTMQPVEEAFWKDDAWRRRNLRYYPWHGRGYVQLTWLRNYERADEECGLGGALVADLAMAMKPDIAAQILVRGMEGGWFTTKKLADYLPIDGQAGHDAFKAARRIINGQDKASEIAKIALAMDAALEAGGWGE